MVEFEPRVGFRLLDAGINHSAVRALSSNLKQSVLFEQQTLFRSEHLESPSKQEEARAKVTWEVIDYSAKAQKRSSKKIAKKAYTFTIIAIHSRAINHNRLNVGRMALERPAGALINCSLLQSGEEEPKWD